jgi:hypothetical protein
MNVECTDNKTFQLLDDGAVLGTLNYKNLLSFKAEISLPGTGVYDIKSVGFFGTSITVTKNEIEIAVLQMNWKGQIVMNYRNEEFLFKAHGVFNDRYIIENKAEEKLIQFVPKFKWGKMQYNYDISYSQKPDDSLFVLLGVYASTYYVTAMSGQL